tara:strand:- start:1428 stop:2000 length:573 start_codon:yes stop_codon:yes gene_type:complete
MNKVINISKKNNIKEFDALIVGGGGSGMRTSLELAKSGLNTAVISKVFPTRSHTVSAQGGITCAIQSADPNDDWRWHMYDTVKGSDYIGDQDAIEYMCSEGPKAVYELEHMGFHFLDLKMEGFIKDHLVDNLKILEKVDRQLELVQQQIEQVMHFFILSTKTMLKREQTFLTNGLLLILLKIQRMRSLEL